MSNVKKKSRFNVIDFIIVVIVICCIAGVIARYNVVNRIVVNANRDEVEISFLVTGISPAISDLINDGDEFYSESSGYNMGTLVRHNVSDAKLVYSNDRGEPVVGSDATKRDVIGTLRAFGVMSDEGFMLNGTQFLSAGKNLTIQSLDVQLSVIITEIKQTAN